MPSPAPEPLTTRPLSIWLVNPFDDLPGEGVPALRYWSLARGLAARGHDVTWWSATWSHRRKATRSVPPGLHEAEGFRVRLVAVRPYEKNVSLARLASHRDFGATFERLADESIASGQFERPDIIVASLPPLESAEAAIRVARRVDAVGVVDVQDLWPETFARLIPGPAFLRKPLASLLLRGMERRRQAVLAAADAVSTTTRTFADVVFPQVPADRPRHVCHVGTLVQEFPTIGRYVDAVPLAGDQAAPAATFEPLQCIYAGSLGSGQDLDALVSAARSLSAAGTRTVLHVAGTGPFEASLRSAAGSLRGSCEMQVHGLLDRTGYMRLLSRCEVGLVLVKPDSLVAVPNKACDYAAASLALVNSLPGELNRLIETHAAGVSYTAGDGGSLARAITGLANDRRALLGMRHAARRLALAEFDRERIYPPFLDWLETLTG